jgi:hypothetical protein
MIWRRCGKAWTNSPLGSSRWPTTLPR